MNVLNLSDDPVFSQQAGATKLADDRWVAYVKLGQFGNQAVVMSAEAPTEYQAIKRLNAKCEAWSVLMTLQIAEGLSPRLAEIETEATKEIMRSVGMGDSLTLSGHSTKKSEPS